MTLVIAASGPESIWLLTDRRLSYKNRPPKEDGRKLMLLETTDGVALLGYAGLGATAGGVEPSDWMERVLRDRNHPLKDSLLVLTQAVGCKLAPHIESLTIKDYPFHTIFIAAFLQGKPAFYTIDIIRPPGSVNFIAGLMNQGHKKQLQFGQNSPFIAAGGSGASILRKDKSWSRILRKVIEAHDSGRLSPQAVAAQLAQLNYTIHKKSKTVGPRCIVAWRFRKGGGGHEFYYGVDREQNSSMVFLPTIANGIPLNSVIQVVLPHFNAMFEAFKQGQDKQLDSTAINAELARLPEGHDENIV